MQDGHPEGKWNGSWGPDSLEPDAKDAENLHVCMFDKPEIQGPSKSNDAASWLQFLLDEHSGPCELSNN